MTQNTDAIATVEHVAKIGRRTVDEYEVRWLGDVIATAHCVGVPDDTWSIKMGSKFLGLTKGRATAVTNLERIAAMANAQAGN